MSNYTIGGAKESKQYLEVAPDGIWRGMRLTDMKFNDEKQRLEMSLVQESTGGLASLYFKKPGDDWSEMRKTITLEEVEIFCLAFIPLEKRATEVFAVETFEDFCNYFTNLIDLETAPLADIKQLYTSNNITLEAGKSGSPYKTLGSKPFISTSISPAVLSIAYDTADGRKSAKGDYRRYTSFTVTYLEPVNTEVEEDELPEFLK